MIERVLVLVLTCCMFLGIWHQDSAQQESWRVAHRLRRDQAAARTELVQFERQQSNIVEADHNAAELMADSADPIATVSEPEPPMLRTVARRVEERDLLSAVSVDPGDVPLPTSMVPGTFSVVNHTGFVGQMQLKPEDLVQFGVAPSPTARKIHTVHAQDGQPWYLIRITDRSPSPTASSVTSLKTTLSWLAAHRPSWKSLVPAGFAELNMSRPTEMLGQLQTVFRGWTRNLSGGMTDHDRLGLQTDRQNIQR